MPELKPVSLCPESDLDLVNGLQCAFRWSFEDNHNEAWKLRLSRSLSVYSTQDYEMPRTVHMVACIIEIVVYFYCPNVPFMDLEIRYM